MTLSNPPTNRHALIAFIAAILTIVSFCIGVAPIPLTGLVCYPAAILWGIVAMLFGVRSMRQLHSSGERGRWMAWFGISCGALTILMILFLITLTIIILFYGMSAIHPIWPQYIGPTL